MNKKIAIPGIAVDWEAVEKYRATLLEKHRQEMFYFLASGFNIVLARYLTQGHEKVTVQPAKVAEAFSLDQPTAIINTDGWETADLSYPIIVASFEIDGSVSYLVIDGYHRIRKAYEIGVRNLDAFILTVEETHQCRI